MPYMETTIDPQAPVYFNVIRAVGADCPNEKEDVKLVQFLLQQIYKMAPAAAPKGVMTVDGICGPITKNWILKFQLDMRGVGNPVQADKRVDRGRNHSSMGSLSKSFYTIVLLNVVLSKVNPGALARVPSVVKLTPAGMVPPPQADVVYEDYPRQVPAVGGL